MDIQVMKVGVVSCSGEEIPEGTLCRLACRKVLDERPGETVTICLPLVYRRRGRRAHLCIQLPHHHGGRLRQALRR